MRSAFDRLMEPCARTGLSRQLPPAATSVPAHRSPHTISTRFTPGPVWEPETETAFLKTLIAYEDGETSLQLRASLAEADRRCHRIRRAIILMATLFVVSLAGLSYCAILLPQIFSNPTHLVTKSLSVLGLASLIAQLEFVGYLFWHRSAANRIHRRCRQRILQRIESQLKASSALEQAKVCLRVAPQASVRA